MLRFLLEEKNMSLYRLEKESHISHATLSDLYNEKYNINKCSVDMIYQLSKVLNIDMKELYELLSYKTNKYITYNQEFDLFKSSICQELKTIKDKNFLYKYLKTDMVRKLFDDEKYPEALYLLSIIDYLCTLNHLPLVDIYDDLRNVKLDKLFVSESLFLLLKLKKTNITEIIKESNPFFLKHNIAEAEIENVY